MTTESALVVLVPEAELLVRPFRARFDASAAAGLGAHITLLYPFVEPEKIGESDLDSLAECFHGFSPIAFSLTKIRQFFAQTLYLAPDPDEPFRQLTMAIWRRFPDQPPYGGAWPDIVPHLSIGRFGDQAAMDQVAADLATALEQAPPIRARAGTVALIENTAGRWTARHTYTLGG